MKIQIISDIHQEFGMENLYFDRADIIILAGDINLGTKGVKWIKSAIKEKPVIYVLGNHEYYKGTYPKTLNKIIESAKGSNIHVLENEYVMIEDITFHGATMWTDFSLFGNPRKHGMICQPVMNDYKKRRRDPSYSKLRTIDTFQIHNKSIKWLEESLTLSSTEKNIVVTHHAPSIKSLPEKYKTDPISSAYASNLEYMTERFNPDLWIHGHIHTPCDYNINKTRIICNPHGYISDKYNGYQKELIVEI